MSNTAAIILGLFTGFGFMALVIFFARITEKK